MRSRAAASVAARAGEAACGWGTVTAEGEAARGRMVAVWGMLSSAMSISSGSESEAAEATASGSESESSSMRGLYDISMYRSCAGSVGVFKEGEELWRFL